MRVVCPVLYEDCERRVIPADRHGPETVVRVAEEVEFEVLEDGSRLVRVTMPMRKNPPKQRYTVLLPADLFSEKVIGGSLR